MFHYGGEIQTARGDALANWYVEVVILDSDTVVPIYADEDYTEIKAVSGVANRAKSDAYGNVDLFVEDGLYSLKYYNAKGVYQRTLRYIPMYGSLSGPIADGITTINTAKDTAVAAAASASVDAATATAGASTASAAATTATTQASLAVAVNGVDKPYANAYASSLPKGVTKVTVGGTAITGATLGEYALIPSGGSITGVSATLVVTSATAAYVRVDNPGLGSGTTPPTFANPAGATIPAGTTLTATVGSLIPDQGKYWAVSSDSSQILLYGNNGGSVATAPFGGTQLVLYGKAAVDAAVAAANSAASSACTTLVAVNAAGATQITAIDAEGATQVSAVNTAGTTQTNAINTAGATQIAAVNTAGTTQISAITSAGAAAYRADNVSAENEAALAGSTTRYFRRAAGSANVTSQYSVGRFFDVGGGEIVAGDQINAIEVETACPATAASIVLKVWQRPLLVGGVTNPTLNGDFGSANDVLISTTTFSPTTLGLTTTNKRVVMEFPNLVVLAGYTYGFERYALDGSAAKLTMGYGRCANSAYSDVRFRGLAHTTASGGFTSVPATYETSDGLLRLRKPITSATLSTAQDRLSAESWERDRAASRRHSNYATLIGQADRLPVTVPGGGIVFIGDSNTRQLSSLPITVGNRITDRLADFVTTTVYNKGLPAQTSTYIKNFCQQAEGTFGPVVDGTAEPALTAAQKNMVAVSMVGTNDTVATGTSATVLANAIAIEAVFSSSTRVLQRGYLINTTYSTGSLGYAESRRYADLAKAQFGGRFVDTQAEQVRAASITGTRDNLKRGKFPSEFVQADGLHWNDAYSELGAASLAGPIRAMCGGAPYVHDDIFTIRSGDALGTAIGTVRTLGSFYAGQLRIISGNNDDIVRLDGTTGALTRGAGVMADDIRVVEVQIGNRSNVAAITMMRCADGTAASTATRVRPTPASILSASLSGVSSGLEQTIAMCLKINGDANSGGLFHQGAGTTAMVAANGKTLSYNVYNTANTLRGSAAAPQPINPYDYHWYFFGRKSDGTIVARTDKMTAVTVAGTADNMPIDQLYTIWGSQATGGGTLDLSFKSVMMFSSFIDFTVDATVDLFRNPTTGAPVDLGASGTVSGVTPYLWLRGNARDAIRGINYGTGGNLYGPIYYSRNDVGFEDDFS